MSCVAGQLAATSALPAWYHRVGGACRHELDGGAESIADCQTQQSSDAAICAHGLSGYRQPFAALRLVSRDTEPVREALFQGYILEMP